MSYSNRYNNRKKLSVIDFLSPKVIFSILLLLGSILFYYRWTKKKNEELESNNPLNEDLNADSIKPKSTSNAIWERVKEDTRKIAHHLGVNYAWYNPQSWTENDSEVAQLLMQQRPNIQHVENLYFKVYAKGRNLKNDVYKSLDKSELNKVIAYYKLKGNTF